MPGPNLPAQGLHLVQEERGWGDPEPGIAVPPQSQALARAAAGHGVPELTPWGADARLTVPCRVVPHEATGCRAMLSSVGSFWVAGGPGSAGDPPLGRCRAGRPATPSCGRGREVGQGCPTAECWGARGDRGLLGRRGRGERERDWAVGAGGAPAGPGRAQAGRRPRPGRAAGCRQRAVGARAAGPGRG